MATKPSQPNKQGHHAHANSGFTCPECGGHEVVQDIEKGERICASCGLVVSEHRIDTGPEWRAFTSEEKDSRSRAGVSDQLFDS